MPFTKSIATTLVLAALATLSGCATNLPMEKSYPEKSATTERSVLTQLDSTWSTVSADREGKAMLVLVTPYSVPDEVRARPIELTLEAGSTIKDLVAVMGNQGYSIILADEEAGDKTFYLPRFKGTVGSLLKTVGRATNVWFTWSDGAITVSSSEKISVTLPQEETLAKRVAEGLKDLGIEKAATSWQAGMVTLNVTPQELAKVRVYLQRMTNNAAMVSLQVAIVNVQMSQDAKRGIDWTKLQLAVGSNYAASGLSDMTGFKPVSGNSSMGSPTNTGIGTGYGNTGTTTGNTGNTGTGGTTTPGNTTGGTTGSTPVDQALAAVGLMSGGMKGLLTTSAFSFTGLYDFLQTYGSTETKQNVVLKTVAGEPVELKSLTQTPYVESIDVTSSGLSNGTQGNTMGSAKTAKADDGITLKMMPTYDAAANTVTVKMDLALKAVLGFNNLSAGNQIGQLSQPTTAERSFNDVLRVRPGQTVVVGGITYDSVGNNTNGITGHSGKLDHEALKVNRNSLFIVVRPTVAAMGQVTEEEDKDLFATAKDEPVKATKQVAKDDLPVQAPRAQVSTPAPKKANEKPLAPVKADLPKKAVTETAKPQYDAAGYVSVPLRAKE